MSEIRVLFAENKDTAELFDAEQLKKNKIQLSRCTSGLAVLDHIHKQGTDLIVLSNELPDIDGFQLSCLLKSTEQTTNFPIIQISSQKKNQNNLWQKACLADSIFESDKKNSADLIQLVKILAESNSLKTDAQPVPDKKSKSSKLSSPNFIELLNESFIEQLISHLTRPLLGAVSDHSEFGKLFFALANKLFNPDFCQIIVNHPERPWSLLQSAEGLDKDVLQSLTSQTQNALNLNRAIDTQACGTFSSNKNLSKTKLLELTSTNGRKLAAILFGWSDKSEIDDNDKQALESFRKNLTTVVQLLISEDSNRILKEQTQYFSTMDSLTGLYNLEFFMGFLQQQLLFSLRQKLPVGLCLIELDKLAELNNQFGPDATNTILQTVSQQLSKRTRASDLLARYATDQLAVVLPNTDEAGMKVLAEKLRTEVERIKFPTLDGSPLHATITVGCAQFNFKEPTPEAILRDAKVALIKAKEKGYNCISN